MNYEYLGDTYTAPTPAPTAVIATANFVSQTDGYYMQPLAAGAATFAYPQAVPANQVYYYDPNDMSFKMIQPGNLQQISSYIPYPQYIPIQLPQLTDVPQPMVEETQLQQQAYIPIQQNQPPPPPPPIVQGNNENYTITCNDPNCTDPNCINYNNNANNNNNNNESDQTYNNGYDTISDDIICNDPNCTEPGCVKANAMIQAEQEAMNNQENYDNANANDASFDNNPNYDINNINYNNPINYNNINYDNINYDNINYDNVNVDKNYNNNNDDAVNINNATNINNANYNNNYNMINYNANNDNINGNNNYPNIETSVENNLVMFKGRHPSYPDDLNRLIHPYKCDLCRTRINSWHSAKDHYESKIHDRNITNWINKNYTERGLVAPNVKRFYEDGPSGPYAFYCELCDINLTSIRHANQHYAGRKHRLIANSISNALSCDNFGFNENGDPYNSSFIPTNCNPMQGGQVFDMSNANFNDTRCTLCNISVTAATQMPMHLQGAKHCRKVALANIQAAITSNSQPNYNATPILNIDYSLYRTSNGFYHCAICNIWMCSVSALQQHLIGKKHIRRETDERKMLMN